MRVKFSSFLISCLLLICFTSVKAEKNPPDPSKSEVKPRRARINLKKEEYLRASYFLSKALKDDPSNAYLNFYMGVCFMETGRPEEALPYLETAFMVSPDVSEWIHYYLGRSYHFNMDFDKAKSHLEKDLALQTQGTEEYSDTRDRLTQLVHAKYFYNNPQPYRITNLGESVNSMFPDFSAAFVKAGEGQQKMFFTSRRPRRKHRWYFRRNNQRYYVEDINEETYSAEGSDTSWSTANRERKIQVWKHDASVWYQNDSENLIFYLDVNGGDLFTIEKGGEGKAKKKSLGPNINTQYHEPSAFMTADGQKLYYVSDKPGGQGLKDIYVSEKDAEGNWSPGMPVSGGINTPEEEDSPFISHDGKSLYFSSRGHNTMGGYDVFRCDLLPDGNWSKPVNLGYPINSAGDDIYYYQLADGESFYYTSYRPGGIGEKDIYFGSKIKQIPVQLTGIVIDKLNGDSIPATISIVDADDPKSTPIDIRYLPEKGQYVYDVIPGKEYVLTAASPGYYGYKERFAVLPTGEVVSHNPVIPLPIDEARGTILTGVVKDSISRKPLACELDVIDTETNQVISQIKTNPETGIYKTPVPPGRRYLVIANTKRHKQKTGDVAIPDEPGTYERDFELADYRIGKIYQLDKIYFDVDKWTLRPESITQLEHLLKVLNDYPTMKIEIAGHTDSDASDDYNLVLSAHRAEVVMEWLIERGIAKDRLDWRGFGERKPFTSNDSKSNKQLNRRTEFKVVEI